MRNLTLVLFLLISFSVSAQEAKKSHDLLNLYIDCDRCDREYYRDEITFVNHVRDRQDADVHLLILRNRTGAAGRLYTLQYFGLNGFTGLNDTLTVTTTQYDTDDEARRKLVKVMKMGLMRYISRTEQAAEMNLKIGSKIQKSEQNRLDEWDNWVFRTRLNGFFNGEESQNFYNFRTSFSANRTTEDWKFQISFNNSYNESNFDYDNTTIKNITRSQGIWTMVVMSLNDHWSAGVWSNFNSSTYRNIDLSAEVSAGVEYNIFPYKDFSTRQLKFQYRLIPKYNNYHETTIYFKDNEMLFQQELEILLELNQPWGQIDISLEASNYFHDLEKNNLDLNTDFELQLIKGLSLNLSSGVTRVHDQITLPLRDASLDEVLLQRRELETQWEFYGHFGISYTFGSIYNNIVNPRFD